MDEDKQPERIDQSHEIGTLIRHARKRKRWSHNYLADKIKVARKTITNLERGQCAEMAFETVLKAADSVNMVVLDAPRKLQTAEEIIFESEQGIWVGLNVSNRRRSSLKNMSRGVAVSSPEQKLVKCNSACTAVWIRHAGSVARGPGSHLILLKMMGGHGVSWLGDRQAPVRDGVTVGGAGLKA